MTRRARSIIENKPNNLVGAQVRFIEYLNGISFRLGRYQLFCKTPDFGEQKNHRNKRILSVISVFREC